MLAVIDGVWGWQVGRPPQALLLRGPRASNLRSSLWVCQAIFSGKLEMLIHAPFKILLQGQIPWCITWMSFIPQSPSRSPKRGEKLWIMKKLNSCAKSRSWSSRDIISVCGSVPIEIPILWPRAVMVDPRPSAPHTANAAPVSSLYCIVAYCITRLMNLKVSAREPLALNPVHHAYAYICLNRRKTTRKCVRTSRMIHVSLMMIDCIVSSMKFSVAQWLSTLWRTTRITYSNGGLATCWVRQLWVEPLKYAGQTFQILRRTLLPHFLWSSPEKVP
jgi:hypothetical protein